jgi:integration host factor subunit beta
MTKTDIALDLARVLDVSKKDARAVLEIILDSMVRALHKGERVELRGFGTFSVHTRPARTGRNPATGASLNVPAKTVPAFRPSKELKSLINGVTGRAARRNG